MIITDLTGMVSITSMNNGMFPQTCSISKKLLARLTAVRLLVSVDKAVQFKTADLNDKSEEQIKCVIDDI